MTNEETQDKLLKTTSKAGLINLIKAGRHREDKTSAEIERLRNILVNRDSQVQFLEPYKDMYEEIKKERDGWMAEYRAARSEVERLKQERDEARFAMKSLQENAYDASTTIEQAKDLLNRWIFSGSLHDASLQNETVNWVQEVEKKIIGE
jgi:predicted  nucleic acid-binding Zn-ribbon protein